MPHLVFDHISECQPSVLLELGLRAALVDLDNTLLNWGDKALDPEVTGWVEDALEAGLKLCLLSNTRSRRAAHYAESLGIPWVGAAKKPSRRGARRALSMVGCDPKETAIIGDQLFTDILMGRRLGLYTILVRPGNLREQPWMRMVRLVERLFWPELKSSWPPDRG